MDKYLFTKNSTNLNPVAEENFFLNQDLSYEQKHLGNKRLNGYDSSILQEEAYKSLKDDILKMEYQITRLENELNNINAQIQAVEEINDFDMLTRLMPIKQQLEEELALLLSSYKEKSLSSKISGGFIYKIKEVFHSVFKLIESHKYTFIAHMPGKFSSTADLRQAVTKLENINKNVDELINLEIPYGENSEKYEQLSKYIVKANSIESKIVKSMKN